MTPWMQLALGLLSLWALWGLALWLADDGARRTDGPARRRAEELSRSIELKLVSLEQAAPAPSKAS